MTRYYPTGVKRKPHYTKSLPDSLEGEQWLPVVGFEGIYSVSNLGRVWSHVSRGRLLKPAAAGRRAEANVRVNLSRDDVAKNYRVHVLVLEAFRGAEAQPRCGGPAL